ncbi:hypothetical protein LSH36_3g08015 [Paralvinella palmiformis]|uniref:FANCI solenoid 3 domain-containing protein n=1 Tax=Paralvinella palmiformis TaxID=53620 RepID=A0AAD9NKB5_9ANNE|nr:hypothetical protein LSH36_3g08015 [Paralvinella palmiformis]
MKDKSAAGGSTGSKRKHAGSGKALGSGVSLSKHNSLVSFDFINRIITSLYGDVQPDGEAGLSCLRNSIDFKHYILSVTLHKVTQVNQTGNCEGDEWLTEKTVLKYCTKIAGGQISYTTIFYCLVFDNVSDEECDVDNEDNVSLQQKLYIVIKKLQVSQCTLIVSYK